MKHVIASSVAAIMMFTPTPASATFEADANLPVVDIKLHAYGVEIISAAGDEYERLTLVTDPIAFAYSEASMTLLECANVATTTCGTAGVAWVRFRINAQTGEESCEFQCNTTGTGVDS